MSSNRVIFRGRDTGFIEGDVYITERKPEHVMIKFHGFGVSTGVLEFVISEFDVKKVRILYKSPALNRSYEYDIMTFLLSKKRWIDTTTDGNEDVQKFVSLEEQDWDEIKEGLPFFQKIKKKKLLDEGEATENLIEVIKEKNENKKIEEKK
jgi:hypothetical protein